MQKASETERGGCPCNAFVLRILQIYTCLKHASLQISHTHHHHHHHSRLFVIVIVVVVIVSATVIFIAAGVVITNVFLYLISGQMFMQLYVII